MMAVANIRDGSTFFSERWKSLKSTSSSSYLELTQSLQVWNQECHVDLLMPFLLPRLLSLNFLIVDRSNFYAICKIIVALLLLLCPLVLYGCQEDDLGEGNHLAEDEPTVNHLDVGGGGQALHLADEDRGHHQHRCQVHTQGGLEEEGLEEGGGKGDCQ